MSDFITTIDSDDEYETPIQNGESSRIANGNAKSAKGKGKSARQAIPDLEDDEGEGEMNGASGKGKKEAKDLNPEFRFDGDGSRADGLDLWGGDEVTEKGKGEAVISVDDIIARRTGKPLKAYRERKRKIQSVDEEEEVDDSEEEDEDEEEEEDGGMDVDMDGESDSGSEGFGAGALDIDMSGGSDEEDDDEDDDEDEDDEDEDGDEDEDEDDDSEDEPAETAAELARKAAFFSSDPTKTTTDDFLPSSFASMNLSRPLLRALTSLNFNTPTPIQSRAIPLALLGRDILGSAVTGSGKTGAFMIPILERLAYRDRGKGGAACRVLVLCPTRELAVQCEAVGKALAERGGLDVRFALLVGGLSLSAQAHTLRTLPDILIATPGRLIDHLTNTPSFTLSALDILVMDEADRMLEQGFTDELNEIIRACPRSRQTMLFSATMTDSVDELVKLSLDKPIRVFVDPKRSTASGLVQEFVRIRSDDARTPALLALCKRTVHEKCIVFFRSKALAHQMRVVFGLLGMKAAELHGNLTQEQRLNALNDFKAGRVDYLLATDLASRGLDIKGVETVINYDMPGQLAQYTHRVGRTARAGRKGRSISLVGEPDRKMLKLALKQTSSGTDTSGTVQHRMIPADAISGMAAKLEDLKEDVADILKEEKEEKALRQAEMEVRKGSNMVEHEEEIFGRPKREWFQSEKQKLAAKNLGKEGYVSKFPSALTAAEPEKPKIKRGKYDGMSRRLKRRKMAMEADAEEGGIRDQGASIRAAKKAQRPIKITENQPNKAMAKGKGKGGKGKKDGKTGGAVKEGAKGLRGGKKSAFDGPERAKKHEGMRAQKVKVNLDRKGGKKGKGRK